MTYQGKLQLLDLGTGGWVLVGDDGARHALVGDIPRELRDRHVEVDGEVAEGGGFMMTGDPTIVVHRVRAR
jgi:hypothetical protein